MPRPNIVTTTKRTKNTIPPRTDGRSFKPKHNPNKNGVEPDNRSNSVPASRQQSTDLTCMSTDVAKASLKAMDVPTDIPVLYQLRTNHNNGKTRPVTTKNTVTTLMKAIRDLQHKYDRVKAQTAMQAFVLEAYENQYGNMDLDPSARVCLESIKRN